MPIPPLIDGRGDVHPGESSPHMDCPDPATCDCDCHGCKRAWERAGRPSPSPRESTMSPDWIRGARAAADVAASYNRDSTHPYRLDDCILAKLNIGGPPRPNEHASSKDDALAYNRAILKARTEALNKATTENTTACDLLRRARIRLVDEPSAKELDTEIVAFLGQIPGLVCTECDRPILRGEVYAGRTGSATHHGCLRTQEFIVFKTAGEADPLSPEETCPGATTDGSQRCVRKLLHLGRCFDGKYTFVNGDPPVTREASYAEARDAQKFKE